MIRNLFKRIAEFVTGSSKDDDSSAIPFAELSRKKAEEQTKKERAERRRRPNGKKNASTPKEREPKPQRENSRQKNRGKQDPKRTPGEQDPKREKNTGRKTQGKPSPQTKAKRPSRDQGPVKNQQPPQNKKPKEAVSERTPRRPAWNLSDFQVPEKEGEVRFHDLDLPIKLMQGIAELGFQYATPIQAGSLPETLKGRDAIGKAQTGTGKSAAFLITIITQMAKKPMRGGPEKGYPRALILAPTRELALQIEKDARDLCKFTPYKIVALYGGTGYDKQKKGVASSVDIVVATPGRLIDFKNQKLVDLSRVEMLVIDEADRMLDMGFIPDIRKIVYATPHKDKRQTLFFSATYSSDVMRLAEQWTQDPHNIEIEPDKLEASSINQKIFLVTSDEKFPLLYNLITIKELTKVLVFTNRRDQARRLCERLIKYNIKADLLSGEVAQNKRIRALEDFRSGKVEILVATDVAARGLHIDEISHVINYHLPQDPEHYVHRIGRTGRAGATGTSVSFACEDDSYYIPAIEELLDHKLICEYPENYLLQEIKPPSRGSQKKPTHHTKGNDSSNRQSVKPAEPETKTKEPQEQRRPARNPRKSHPKESPMPSSPWLDEPMDEPKKNHAKPANSPARGAAKDATKQRSPWYDDHIDDQIDAPTQPQKNQGSRHRKEAPMPRPWYEDEPEVTDTPVKAPAEDKTSKEAPMPRPWYEDEPEVTDAPVKAPAEDKTSKEAPMPRPWYEDEPEVTDAPVKAPAEDKTSKEAPMPRPWYEDKPEVTDAQVEAPAEDKTSKEAPMPRPWYEDEPEVTEAPVKAPAEDKTSKEAPMPRPWYEDEPEVTEAPVEAPAEDKTSKEAPMPRPWYEDEPETTDAPEAPAEDKQEAAAETLPTAIKETATSEPTQPSETPIEPARPKETPAPVIRRSPGQRPTRNNRKPNASKYRKRSGTRYSKTTRSD